MNSLQFDQPGWLQALWLLVPLAALLIRGERRRRADAAALLAPERAAELLPPQGGARPWRVIAAQLVGVAALIGAAAGPRAGVSVEPARERGADLLIALDVSKSMLSADVAPNRLERAKSDVRDLTAAITGHRLGLVLFAGRAVIACPLTTDRAFFLGALDRAGPGSAPRGGTAIGDALRLALEALPAAHDRDQAIVLLTDGEDHDSFPVEAAHLAAERGVRVFAVGLGDPGEGARVPATAQDGGATYLKHGGQEVWSKLDESVLTAIATATGGAYVPARTTVYDLGALYRDHLAQLTAGDLGTTRRQRHTPRFQWSLALGLAALLLARAGRTAPARRPARGADGTAPATRLAATLLVAFACAPVAWAAPGEEASRSTRREAARQVDAGLAAANRGDAAGALAQFEAATTLLPNDPTLAYDRGTAKLATGDLDGADQDLLLAAAARDSALAASARFNRAHVEVARAQKVLGADPAAAKGDAREQAIAAIEAAIAHDRSCLALAPDHATARAHLEQLRAWLKWIGDEWARRDREQRRDELDVLQFLDWLANEEGGVRSVARDLARETDSPMRRAAQEALRRRQQALEEELPTLKEKLAAAVEQAAQQAAQQATAQAAPPAAGTSGGASPGGNPPSPPPPAPDPAKFEAAARTLVAAADAIGRSMTATREALATAEFSAAETHGRAATDGLLDLWNALADFGSLVQRGLKDATALHAGVARFAPPADPADPANAGSAPVAPPALADDAEAQRGLKETAERVAALVPLLPQHAQALAGQEALAAACAKTLESAPALSESAQATVAALTAADAAAALPSAEQLQRLLQEIADLLPKQEPQDQDEKQDQDQKQQQDAKQDPPQEPQEPSAQDDPKEQPQDPQAKDDTEPSPERRKEQAQALLRKALERAKQKQDEQKKAEEAVLVGPGGVDRDW